jgi:hypothetical protein
MPKSQVPQGKRAGRRCPPCNVEGVGRRHRPLPRTRGCRCRPSGGRRDRRRRPR